MKARYSMSLASPGSGQMRIARSGSWSAKVSRQACALPICLSRLTMSSAMSPPLVMAPAAGAGKRRVDEAADQLAVMGALFGRLQHENDDHLLRRIDPE